MKTLVNYVAESLLSGNYIKYFVSASRKTGFSSTQKSAKLETLNKVEAINHAKKLEKSGLQVNFNFDTYENHRVIENNFARFENSEINIYSKTKY